MEQDDEIEDTYLQLVYKNYEIAGFSLFSVLRISQVISIHIRHHMTKFSEDINWKTLDQRMELLSSFKRSTRSYI